MDAHILHFTVHQSSTAVNQIASENEHVSRTQDDSHGFQLARRIKANGAGPNIQSCSVQESDQASERHLAVIFGQTKSLLPTKCCRSVIRVSQLGFAKKLGQQSHHRIHLMGRISLAQPLCENSFEASHRFPANLVHRKLHSHSIIVS